jgi:hypothetical protein
MLTIEELALWKHEAYQLMRREDIVITQKQWDDIFHKAVISIGQLYHPPGFKHTLKPRPGREFA